MQAVKKLLNYYLSLDRDPDIVQFHSYIECFYYLKKRKNRKAKTVMFLHTDGIPFKMELEALPALDGTSYFKRVQESFSWTVRNVDRIVFIAKIGQKNFLDYYPNRTLLDTSVILNGINDLSLEQLKEVSQIKKNGNHRFNYRLCCAGTISYRKGQRMIIEALQQLSPDLQKQIQIELIGDGSEKALLEQMVNDSSLTENVVFPGKVANEDIYKHLSANNIYILMSKNEGLPISIIEAMRAGLPIISTKVSGIPELIEEEYNGFLINPDVDELVALLNRLPKYDWEQMGRNSRTRFEKDFTFERMEKEFCDMYDLTLSM